MEIRRPDLLTRPTRHRARRVMAWPVVALIFGIAASGLGGDASAQLRPNPSQPQINSLQDRLDRTRQQSRDLRNRMNRSRVERGVNAIRSSNGSFIGADRGRQALELRDLERRLQEAETRDRLQQGRSAEPFIPSGRTRLLDKSPRELDLDLDSLE